MWYDMIHILTGGQLGRAGGILAWKGMWWEGKVWQPGLGVSDEQETGEIGTACNKIKHGNITEGKESTNVKHCANNTYNCNDMINSAVTACYLKGWVLLIVSYKVWESLLW